MLLVVTRAIDVELNSRWMHAKPLGALWHSSRK